MIDCPGRGKVPQASRETEMSLLEMNPFEFSFIFILQIYKNSGPGENSTGIFQALFPHWEQPRTELFTRHSDKVAGGTAEGTGRRRC